MKLIYFRANPQAVARRFGGPNAEVNVGEKLEEPICVAEDSGDGRPVWAVLIPDGWVATARTRPQFLGVGLNEMKANFPGVYGKVAQKNVRLQDGTFVRMEMEDALPVGASIIDQDLPCHSFAGYNPMTGDPT